MNRRRFQGMSLIISAFCLLVGHLGPDINLFHIISIVGATLFIIGIPAIQSIQPTGSTGWAGIELLELAAVITLLFHSGVIPSVYRGGPLGAISVIAGLSGRMIIGWVTIRNNAFPAWVGWAFFAEGLLNALVGMFNFGSLVKTLPLIILLLGAGALLGYGFVIFNRQRRELYIYKP
jgi:hypothetical protein